MLRFVNFIKLWVIRALLAIEVIIHVLTLILVFGGLACMGMTPGLYIPAVILCIMFFRHGHRIFTFTHGVIVRAITTTSACFDQWINAFEIYLENKEFMKNHAEGFAVIIRI
jgi:hypothetical protein